MSAQASGSSGETCPYCSTLVPPDGVHVCPVACCFVMGPEGAEELVCPYCEQRFEARAGHLCLDLLRLSEPAQ